MAEAAGRTTREWSAEATGAGFVEAIGVGSAEATARETVGDAIASGGRASEHNVPPQ